MFDIASLPRPKSSGRRRRQPLRPVVEELEPRLNLSEVGVNDFRLSFMGPDGNPNFDALNPAVAYNGAGNEYLVVWQGDDVTANEYEIFGQRVNAATGAQVGGRIRISDMGPDGDPNFGAFYPAVAYNASNNEYLVVWHGNDNTAGQANFEYEIYGQRINAATGVEVGFNDFRISDMGPDGNAGYGAFAPAVAYNGVNNEYLVVWHGDDNTAPLLNDEIEIFGQRLDAATGAEVGANDFRISDMGPNYDISYAAFRPAVAYNGTNNEYLVVWQGDDDYTSGLVNHEREIFVQRLDGATGMEVGDHNSRISDVGFYGDLTSEASNPAVAYNGAANEYLVVWQGDDRIQFGTTFFHEYEIYGQRLSATGAEVGENDFRISDMGPNADTNFRALNPAVAYSGVNNEYLVVWEGNDNTAPLAANEYEIFGQRLRGATGLEVGANDFRLSDMGPDGDTRFGAAFPAVAANGAANEYLAIWMGDDNTGTLVDGEYEIFGQRLNAVSGPPIGFDDSQISFIGSDGVFNFSALDPAVAYNGVNNEYLVVWSSSGVGGSGVEIYGQRFDAATGALLGNDIRISDMGPDGNFAFEARRPAVAYNAVNNEYLVVWSGDDATFPLVNDEFEIFGQRLDAATGAEVGANDFHLSDMGPDGNANFDAVFPAVAYNGAANEYLVVWQGDDNTGTLVDNEQEIFGQRLNGATGAEVGANDFRISDMGPDGNTNFGASTPEVAYNAVNNEYLVVWSGDDTTDNEFQVFGQRLAAATGMEVGANDFRISEMSPDRVTGFGAFAPAVAYNGAANEYLVAWEGDDKADDGYEIVGQRLAAATGAQVGANDFRISDMGTDGDANYEALVPEVAYDGTANEYLVAWHGDDNTGALVNNKYDVYGQRLNAATGAETGVNDFRISEMGPDGNPNFGGGFAVVAYNATNNEYLVVWAGEDDTPPLTEGQVVIFGQRIAAPPAPIGSQFTPPGNEVETTGQHLAQPDPPPPPPPPITAAAFRSKGVAQLRISDAATGELRAVLTPFRGFRGRLRFQMEDVNGDGALELVVRALVKGRRRKKVFDAVTLAPLPPSLA
jgi:hypothetical protein